MIRPLVTLMLFAAGVAGAAAQTTPAPQAQPSPSGAPSAAPVPVASAVPTPAPASPAPASPPPTPVATPTPVSPYGYVVEPTPDPSASPSDPKIVRLELNDRVIHPGGLLAVRVTTSSDVQRVFASTAGQNVEIPRASDGLFAGLMEHIPGFIPPWYFRTYQVAFTAFTADGRRATAVIPIALSR